MNAKQLAATATRIIHTGLISAAVFQLAIGSAFAAPLSNSQPSRDDDTATPIKHVIVIIGENRSFDHVFATYVPKKGEKVWNLLSRRHCEGGRHAWAELLQGGTERSEGSGAGCIPAEP